MLICSEAVRERATILLVARRLGKRWVFWGQAFFNSVFHCSMALALVSRNGVKISEHGKQM
jgi:hypothetical protein